MSVEFLKCLEIFIEVKSAFNKLIDIYFGRNLHILALLRKQFDIYRFHVLQLWAVSLFWLQEASNNPKYFLTIFRV